MQLAHIESRQVLTCSGRCCSCAQPCSFPPCCCTAPACCSRASTSASCLSTSSLYSSSSLATSPTLRSPGHAYRYGWRCCRAPAASACNSAAVPACCRAATPGQGTGRGACRQGQPTSGEGPASKTPSEAQKAFQPSWGTYPPPPPNLTGQELGPRVHASQGLNACGSQGCWSGSPCTSWISWQGRGYASFRLTLRQLPAPRLPTQFDLAWRGAYWSM